MRVDKTKSIYNKNSPDTVSGSFNKTDELMFNFTPNKGKGIQVEKNEDEKQKTYTKTDYSDPSKQVVTTFDAKTNKRISRSTINEYEFSHTIEYFDKTGEKVIKSETQKREDNIREVRYYDETGENLTKYERFTPENRMVITWKNGKPDASFTYNNENKLLSEERYGVDADGEGYYVSTHYRDNGKPESEFKIYMDAHNNFELYFKQYRKYYTTDGKLLSQQYYDENCNSVEEEYINGKLFEKEVTYGNSGRVFESTRYNRKGEVINCKKYDENGNLIDCYLKHTKKFKEAKLDGKIEDFIRQGQTGICYLASTVNSLIMTEKGQKILDDAIDYDKEKELGTVNFRAAGKTYTFTKDEIEKAYSRLGTGDPDFTLLALAYEKYFVETKGERVDGGLLDDVLAPLIGGESIKVNVEDLTDEELIALQEKMQTKDCVLFAYTEYDAVKEEGKMRKGLTMNTHAYAVRDINSKSIKMLEPNTARFLRKSPEEFREQFGGIHYRILN